MTGGNGYEAVRRFYETWFIGHWPKDTSITRISRTADEAHVVDVISMGPRARELAAVVPVLSEALGEGDEEALAVGQRGEAGEALGSGAVAAAAVKHQHERGGARAKGRRHVQVVAAADAVDLEGVGGERALRPMGGRDRGEPGEGDNVATNQDRDCRPNERDRDQHGRISGLFTAKALPSKHYREPIAGDREHAGYEQPEQRGEHGFHGLTSTPYRFRQRMQSFPRTE